MADKTIVALYETATSAQSVRADLIQMGLSEAHVDLITDSDTNIAAQLRDYGVPSDAAQVYAEGVRRGSTLIMAEVDESQLDRALEILEGYDPADVDDLGTRYRETGWAPGTIEEAEAREESGLYRQPGTATGYAAGDDRAGLGAGYEDRTARGRTDEEQVVPIVEEQVDVGKRAVEGGRVRVRTHVVERPVREDVTLRDERVTVERRPATGAADRLGADAFKDRTIEATERHEEPVVSKTARVTEEVVVGKEVDERTESVSGTARKTEVEVEDDTGRRRDR
ncbi:MAG TPA: YsnF/AvaK domain-containing protein [Geminicoccaceae bacterium]|nr:YsnF/AvaK domain-containing protein [Geminicoccaceae bacterium]